MSVVVSVHVFPFVKWMLVWTELLDFHIVECQNRELQLISM